MTQPASSDSNTTETVPNQVQSDRELLQAAAQEGKLLGAYIKLSGPGWLQSAITLGGGSLAGALFLGVLGGTSMIWLQLVAIVMGVVMLSAISYVTLSTGRRPFEAINSEINPALGWSWLIATCMANMIWCMPQFSLAYDALDKNLFALGGGGNGLGDSSSAKLTVTLVLLVAAGFVVLLKAKEGKLAKYFDLFLKALIGLVVICFFGVVVLLAANGELNFGEIIAGLIPNLGQWSQPAGELGGLIAGLPEEAQDYWTAAILKSQRAVMIAAAATAVGINMTFLLPYSMLSRGWDKPFRGLARFDLSTGMAIPYIIVTSCVVIAAASTFHAKIDGQLASSDLAVMQKSPVFNSAKKPLLSRVEAKLGDAAQSTSEEKKLAMAAELSVEEKKLALSLVKRNAFQLSQTLSPLLGATFANLVFGLGVFGMGFSTIIILMLINGYAFREICNQPEGTTPFVVGCLAAGMFGATWVWFWTNPDAKFWLAIFTSSFGAMLLPIAYITFFLMMNSRRILGDEKPTGVSMVIWNVLMIISVIGAIVAASAAIWEKANSTNPFAFYAVMGLLVVFIAALVAGHFTRQPKSV